MGRDFKSFIIISLCLCFIFCLTSVGKTDMFYHIYVTPPTFNPRAIPAETTTISTGLWADTAEPKALCWLQVYDINHAVMKLITGPVDAKTPNASYNQQYFIPWDGTKTGSIIVDNGIYPYHLDGVSRVYTFTTDATYYPADVANYYYHEYELYEGDIYEWEYDVVFVSDTHHRIQKTSDYWAYLGDLWDDVTPPGFSGYAIGLAATNPVAPNTGGKIYALSSGSPYRLYYTQDVSPWEHSCVWSYYPLWGDAVTPSDIACSSDGIILYAVDKGTNKVYKSLDSGANWNPCTAQPGLAASPSLTGVAVDPNDTNIVMVADGANGDLYRSDNGCETGFTRIIDGSANQFYQVSIDNEGYYWISNVANYRVSEYNPINDLEVARVGSGSGDENYQFNTGGVALGLSVNYSPWRDNKYFYVADYLNKKVKKYLYDNYGSDPPVGTNIVVSESGDTTPPAAIDDLSIAHDVWFDVVGSDFLYLQWTAPGNDDNAPATKARAYDFRYSRTPITTDVEFNNATPTLIEYTSHATNNILGSTTFEVQEDISENTQSSGYIYVIDYTNRSVQTYYYASWSGKIFYLYTGVQLDRNYDGNDTVLFKIPYPQGNKEVFRVPGLESNTIYYFAVKSSDEKPNISGLSNTASYPCDPNELNQPCGKTGLLLEWNMVSCPKQPIPNGSNSVFGDDAGIDYMLKWISTWTGPGDTDCKVDLPDCNPNVTCHPDCDGSWVQISTIVPGEGILLYSTKNYDPTDATGTDIIDFSYTLHLNTGWNMIGNPYGTNVNLSACNVTYNSVTKSFADAVTANWIYPAIYIWNGTTYIDYAYTDPAILELWKGYWILSNYNLDLIINKP